MATASPKDYLTLCLSYAWAEFGITRSPEFRTRAVAALERYEDTPLQHRVLTDPDPLMSLLEDESFVALVAEADSRWDMPQITRRLKEAGSTGSDARDLKVWDVSDSVAFAREWSQSGPLADENDPTSVSRLHGLFRYLTDVHGCLTFLEEDVYSGLGWEIVAKSRAEIEAAFDMNVHAGSLAVHLYENYGGE